MPIRNTKQHYGRLTIGLHWLMALMVLGMIFVGFFMGTMEKGPDKIQVIQLHKATGFLVLLLGLFRWYWMLSNVKVQALPNWSKPEIGLSHALKWMLMLMLIVMPVSGWFMSMAAGHGINFYGLFDIPVLIDKNKSVGGFFHEIHEVGAYLITIFVGLHILAALRHHFLVKDNTLNRMLGRDSINKSSN